MKTERRFGGRRGDLRRRSPFFLSTKRRVAVSTAASADDGNETVSTTSVSIVGTTIGFQVDRHGGFRFPAVALAQGVTVLAASVQFTCAVTSTGAGADAAIVVISGEDVDDAAQFAAANENISGRTTTTATVTWVLPPSTGADAWVANDRGPNQRTPNLREIIQEIVDRAGWASGQDIALLFRHDQVGTGARVVATHDHATLTEPTLTVIWSP